MKKYAFPYGGSTGKGDTWDAVLDFELTDEEAARLEASAKAGGRWRLDEDESISDIRLKIEQYAFEENKRILTEDGILDDLREEWESFHDEDEDPPTDDELVEEAMGNWHILYPKELQNLNG